MIARRAALILFASAAAGCGLFQQSGAAVLPPPKGTPTPRSATPPQSAATTIPILPPATPAPSRVWPGPLTYGTVTPIPTEIPTPVEVFPFEAGVTNILLIGSDRRPGATSFRTDTLVLVSIHAGGRGAALLSIPRDLFVYLPGFSMQRINSAYTSGEQYGYPGGGPGLLADTVLYNLGIPVHYQARVEMDGFRRVIDTVGGLDVRVACAYTDWRLRSPDLPPEDEANWVMFTAPAAVVHMDGDYALWYARARGHSSDFDRARRQQEVLRAAYRQVLRLDLIPHIPELYTELSSSVSSDIPLAALVELAALAPRISPAEIHSRFLGRDQVTGWRVPVNGAQVLLPNAPAIRALLEDAFRFEQTDPLVPQSYTTVEVVGPASNPDLALLAAERLEYHEFRTHIGPTSDEADGSTRLIDYGQATAEVRDELLSALGLPAAALELRSDPISPFPFRLVVGSSYDPCFDPTRGQVR